MAVDHLVFQWVLTLLLTLAGPVEIPPTQTALAINEVPTITMREGVYVRFGPGIDYAAHGYLLAGQSAELIAHAKEADDTRTWWQINCPATALDNSCWVSGEEALSTVSAADQVQATSPTALIAIVQQAGDLHVATGSSRLHDAPTEQFSTQLTQVGDVASFAIAPDAQKLAFTRSGSAELFVYNLFDHTTSEITQIGPSGVAIDHFAWSADSMSLYYSTRKAAPSRDLWQVELGEDPIQRFAAGVGGDRFYVSDGGQVLFTRPQAVLAGNVSAGTSSIILTQRTPAALEGFAPQPVVAWVAGQETAQISVLTAEGSANIWRYRARNVTKLETLPTLALAESIQFSETLVGWSGISAGRLRVQLPGRAEYSGIASATRERFLAFASADDDSTPNYAITTFTSDSGHPIVIFGQSNTLFQLENAYRVLNGQWASSETFVVLTQRNTLRQLSYLETSGAAYPLLPQTLSSVDAFGVLPRVAVLEP